jgi:hypothetical protein
MNFTAVNPGKRTSLRTPEAMPMFRVVNQADLPLELKVTLDDGMPLITVRNVTKEDSKPGAFDTTPAARKKKKEATE